MLLSVVVPTYNQVGYLGATLDSLCAQLDPAVEVIVSDNHCDDGTAELLDRYRDRLHVVRPPEHLPVFEHFNWVIEQTSGEWFSVLSSDDLARPTFSRTLADAAGKADDAVLVHAGYEVVDETGTVIDVGVSPRIRRRRVAPKTLVEQLVGPIVNLSAFAARRSAWEEVGGFPEDMHQLGDWGFWLKLVPKGAFVYQPTVVSAYRMYPRVGVKRERAMPGTLDLVRIYLDVVPAVAREVGGVDAEALLVAQRRRLRIHLGELTTMVPTEERSALADVMTPWAASIGSSELLETFVSRGVPRDTVRFSGLRRRIRSVVARVRR